MNEGRVGVRLNPFKGAAGPAGEAVPWSPWGRLLSERPNFTLDPLLHAGCYYVQDSSAMYAGYVFRRHLPDLQHDDRSLRVLDLCAAPGGKTTDLAASLREACGDAFTLVSNEVMRARASVLRDNVALWGDPNVVVTSVDPAVIGRVLPGWFDAVVADVPCSGEGMFRKDPRAEAEWSPAVVELCAARQRRILADVWPALRQGGLLLYATCTYEDSENDANLEWAAAQLGGRICPPDNPFAVWGVRQTRCGNLLRHGEVPGEGQWVGALVKTAPAPAPGAKAGPQDLRPILCGVVKGERKGNDFVPDPDYALSLAYEGEYPELELDRAHALRFLHRDALNLPGAPKGYLLLRFEGHALGFVKNLGPRCNNLLPRGRRIRMDV